jgi:quercetin dioxygenase-like cupin family protein
MASLRAALVLLVYCALSAAFVRAADPDPLVDFPPNVTSFSFRNFPVNGDVTQASGGKRSGLNVSLFPAMASLGITYVRFELTPCGANVAHSHPRATELLTLVSGGPLQVGFVDTRGVFHGDILMPGDVTIFPRGLMHFEINLGTENAVFFSALNSQNPGTLTAGNVLAQIPIRALVNSLNLDIGTAMAFKAAQPPEARATVVNVPNALCQPGMNITRDW